MGALFESDDKEPMFVCCICGNVFTGFGNNPWPIAEREDARCCDTCNSTVVIPARLDLIAAAKDDAINGSRE